MRQFFLRPIALAAAVAVAVTTTGCGTMTGLPGHGGGKRFATEQKLVAASARATLMEIDVTPLRGKKVALVFDFMSDEGGGQMVGGRASLGLLMSGASVVSPVTTTTNTFQVFDLINRATSTNYQNVSGSSSSYTTTTGLISGVGASTSNTAATGTDIGTNTSNSTGTTATTTTDTGSSTTNGTTNIGASTTTQTGNSSGSTTTGAVTTTTNVGGTSSSTTYPTTTTTTTTGATTTTQTTPGSTVTTTTNPSTTTQNTGAVTTNQSGSSSSTTNTGASTNTSNSTTTNNNSGTANSTSAGSTTGSSTNNSTSNSATNGTSTNVQGSVGTQSTGSESSSSSVGGATNNGMQQQAMVASQQTQTKGKDKRVQLDLVYKGLGDYQTIAVPKSDASFLMGQVRNYLMLNGVHVTIPQDPELDAVVYVSVDVFGLVRSRFDIGVYNNELVKAETGIELMAFDKKSGRMIMAPRNANMEAAYREHYMFWAGPIESEKTVQKGEGLLVNFSDLAKKNAVILDEGLKPKQTQQQQ